MGISRQPSPRERAERALRDAEDPGSALPRLHALARGAPPGSDDYCFAHRTIAELIVDRDPWRAMLHARRVLVCEAEDAASLATMGLAATLLGHHRFAMSAYERALLADPANPWYAHNLGHLLDVRLDRPAEGLAWLEAAFARARGASEIAASYAHALARVGKLEEARRVLAGAFADAPSRDQRALIRWIESGAKAPAHQKAEPDAAARPPRPTRHETVRQKRPARPKRTRKRKASSLDDVLLRGLSKLPLDARQRARARSLMREPVAMEMQAAARKPEAVCAAVAYAIAYVDGVPLSPSDVASTFRVSAASLRGAFGTLKQALDLCPNDARYRSRRRSQR